MWQVTESQITDWALEHTYSNDSLARLSYQCRRPDGMYAVLYEGPISGVPSTQHVQVRMFVDGPYPYNDPDWRQVTRVMAQWCGRATR